MAVTQARIDILETELEEARQEIDRLEGIIRTLRARVGAGKDRAGPLRLPASVRLSRRLEKLVLIMLEKEYLTLQDYRQLYPKTVDCEHSVASQVFRVQIQKIREALSAAGIKVTVHNVHSVGYKFTPEDKAVLIQIMQEGVVIP
jgi:hypothetical protein